MLTASNYSDLVVIKRNNDIQRVVQHHVTTLEEHTDGIRLLEPTELRHH